MCMCTHGEQRYTYYSLHLSENSFQHLFHLFDLCHKMLFIGSGSSGNENNYTSVEERVIFIKK